jgi:hypothetical protein
MAVPNIATAAKNLVYVQPSSKAAPGQKGRGQSLGDLADLRHASAVIAIRGVPGGEDQNRRGNKLHQPYHAEIEGAVGERINLPAHGYRGHLIRKFGESASPKIKLKSPVAKKCCGWHGVATETPVAQKL